MTGTIIVKKCVSYWPAKSVGPTPLKLGTFSQKSGGCYSNNGYGFVMSPFNIHTEV